MKKIVLGLAVLGLSLVAADFSQMSTEELVALKGTVAVEDRDAFRTKMQSRLLAMTPEERAAYRTNNGQALGQRLQDGSGAGSIRKGAGAGASQGTVNQSAPAGASSINQRLRDGSGAGSMRQLVEVIDKI